MTRSNAFAWCLIAAAVLLLAVFNQLGWLLWLLLISLLLARLASPPRGRNTLAPVSKKG